MTLLPEELEERALAASNLDEAAEVLAELLNGGYAVWTDGSLYFIKQQVGRINGLKIHVFPNDHPPPHFHVVAPGLNARFLISDGSLYSEAEQIDRRQASLIQGWWCDRSRELLIKTWNETRPSDGR